MRIFTLLFLHVEIDSSGFSFALSLFLSHTHALPPPPPRPVAISFVVNGTAKFAKKHPVISGSYLFGLLILLFGSGLSLTVDQQRTYNNIMNTIDTDLEFDASTRFAAANSAYYNTKGWFSCDSLCERNKRRMEEAKHDLDAIRKEGYNRMSDAKASAGIFSEIGVNEARDSFWEVSRESVNPNYQFSIGLAWRRATVPATYSTYYKTITK